MISLDVESVMRRATDETGLSDFAWEQDEFALEGLTTLLAPDKMAYQFNAKGSEYFARIIVDALKNRLYLQDLISRHPEIEQQQIDAPLFVTGMPRSGTTLLQNLLACDPQRRCLSAWEAHSLNPEKPREEKIADQEQRFERAYSLMHEQKKIHYVDASGPEECNVLLRSSFSMPVVFQLFNRNMDFTLWHLGIDQAQTYAYLKKQLQALNFLHSASQAWTLKSPLHIFYADALRQVFPDARFIMTHRDPRKVLPSTVSLGLSSVSVLSEIKSSEYPEYAAINLMQSEFAAARTIEQCEKLPSDVYISLQYNDLMDDPIACVKNIYATFDEPFGADFVAAMEAYLVHNPQHKYGKHSYSLDAYQISEEQLMQSFAEYIDYFGVKLGQ